MQVRGSVPSLIQGVSQQVPTLRLPSYLSEGSDNIYATINEGLTRRPPSEFIASLSALVDPVADHFINRDEIEKYYVALDAGVLKVWDFEGNLKTVNADDGWDYIAEATRAGFLTVNDYTFVWNRDTVVEMNDEVEPVEPHRGVAWVRQGDYSTTYRVRVGYPATTPTWYEGSYTTSSSSAADIKIANIAAALQGNLTTSLGGLAGGTGFAVSQAGHVLTIYRVDNVDFLLEVVDDATGQNMYALKDKIEKTAALPTMCENGFHIKILGDTSTDKDDWWARFETTDAAAVGIAQGFWKECPEPGTKIALDAATMPHVLIREEDGTFTFREAEWGKRVSGNETLAPPPGFVGFKVERMNAIKQRLEILASNKWVETRPADLFNFWISSAQVLTDADPIDVSPSFPKPFTLRGSAEFQSGMLLLANNVQFLVQSGDIFGPKTASVKPISTFDLQVENGLLSLQQDRVMVALKRQDSTGLLAFRSPSQSLSAMIFDECSALVPTLIPGSVQWIAGSPTENVVVIKASGTDTLFAYKESEDQGKVVQSAWFPWTFKNRTPINGSFIGPDLYVVLKDSSGKFTMERMSLRPFARAALPWNIYLDRRVDLVDEAFEAAGGSTVVSLPWTATAGETAILVLTGGAQAGAVVKATTTGTGTATFPGLYTGPGTVGVVARSKANLSPLYYRRQALGGGEEVVVNGVLQLLRGKVSFALSGPFNVVVKPHDRPNEFTEQVGQPLFGDGDFSGPQDLRTGSQSYPIGAINERVDQWFDTGESPLPMRIASYEWAGDLNLTARPL